MNAPVLYWFPNSLDVPDAHRHLFTRGGRFRCSMARHSEGPADSVRGCLASPFDGVVCTYNARIQRWDQIGKDIWVGADRSAKPQQLLRADHRGGTLVKMADGNEWLVPVANPFVSTCSLPFWHRLSSARRWEKCLQDKYASIGARAADLAAELRAAVLEDRDASTDDDDARQLIADALSINYDVSIEELSVLRVFAPDNVVAAIYALVDWQAMLQAMAAAVKEARTGENVAAPFVGDPRATSATASGAPD